MIKTADPGIEFDPKYGDGGGGIVAQGTPEQAALCAESFTGCYVAPLLGITAATTTGDPG